MQRLAFKMKLLPGYEKEYEKRHDEIWPELRVLLKSKGISKYSIYLDEETRDLFAVLELPSREMLDELPADAIMRKWWDYMSDIMETNADRSPVTIPLRQVFFLP